jgi:dTDP-4-dehydrorhamnose reductase
MSSQPSPLKLLLLGREGQLGQELDRILAPFGQVTALSRPELDLTNLSVLREQIQSAQPDIIINAAAYTAVDRAESEPELAYVVNGQAPGVMAEEADRLRAKLIHVSTDYVFDGREAQPYSPQHPTAPLGVYGRSKLAGEQAIQRSGAQFCILRTAWVYGTYGKGNFVKTMLRLGMERETLKVVADQVGAPTWAADLARAIAQLIPPLSAQGLDDRSDNAPLGTYHYTNSGTCSWYDFAVAIVEDATALGWPLQVKEVLPIATKDYPTPAARPAYSVLNCQTIVPWVGTPPDWRSSLRAMLQSLDIPSP